jgi:hypothetical protein
MGDNSHRSGVEMEENRSSNEGAQTTAPGGYEDPDEDRETAYPDPVNKLLALGDCRELREWPDYLELGLTHEQIPELIRMATDEELNWADSDRPEVWAPIHAWRALGHLRAEDAILPLLELFEELEDCDWVTEEMPTVYGMIGPPAIPPLAEYLADASRDWKARSTAASCLKEIASKHPEARDACIAALARELRRDDEYDPVLNGFIVADLMELKAGGAIAPIREAFAGERVDLSIAGDVEDVEMDLGFRTFRTTPPRPVSLFGPPPPARRRAPVPVVPRAQPKIGRNDPCPCGSGKKYKKCCLNA